MRKLDGKELQGFIKERQAAQVRNLKQEHSLSPKLIVLGCGMTEPSKQYVAIKQTYGEDIGLYVELAELANAEELEEAIKLYNSDETVQGIILQLPLKDINEQDTDKLINLIEPSKDVDGLGDSSPYQAATPLAIQWLLAGYNVDLKGKSLVIIGEGRLVGAPLKADLVKSGYSVESFNNQTFQQGREAIKIADIIISATGHPNLITSDLIKAGAVVVDAGTTSSGDSIVGDVADDVYSREDITITPKIGGVGPLTIAALFDNLIIACYAQNN